MSSLHTPTTAHFMLEAIVLLCCLFFHRKNRVYMFIKNPLSFPYIACVGKREGGVI